MAIQGCAMNIRNVDIETIKDVIRADGVMMSAGFGEKYVDPLLMQVENTPPGMELTRPVHTGAATSNCTQCFSRCCYASYSPKSIKSGTCYGLVSRANVVVFN